MTHAIVSREDRLKRGISDGLLRLSVGLESVEDILDYLTGGARYALKRRSCTTCEAALA